MSLPLRKRTVYFYEINMSSSTRTGIKNPSRARLDLLLERFATLATSKKLPLEIQRSSKARTVLADWQFHAASGHYELLLCRADAALSDVAFRDLSNDNLRKGGKTKVEGIEVSAHAIVRANPNGQSALLMLTMGAYISVSHIERLLKSMSRLASALPSNKDLYYFDAPSGQKDAASKSLKYKVNYSFAVHGHMGQTLQVALSSGEFDSMELIAYDNTAFDAGGNFSIEQRVLKVTSALPKTVTAAAVRNAVRHYRQQPDGAIYDKLRIHYTTAAGKSTSATLSIDDLGAAFNLKEHIEFDVDVEAQSARLNNTILSKMRPLLVLATQ